MSSLFHCTAFARHSASRAKLTVDNLWKIPSPGNPVIAAHTFQFAASRANIKLFDGSIK